MALTKGQTVTQSYELIGMNSVTDASLLANGSRILERMMHTWAKESVETTYEFSVSPGAVLPSDASGLSIADEDGVILNLAIKLATANGIVIGGTLAQDAKTAKSMLYTLKPLSIATNPFMPVGAGNTRNISLMNYQEDEAI